MGNWQSKKAKKAKLRRTHSLDDLDNDGGHHQGGAISPSKFDQQQVFEFKNELQERPQVFVLNNLLLGFMFFENYDKDKVRLLHSSRTTMEKELNPSLLRDETTECIIPDIVFEEVNKNVRYSPLHGKAKSQCEPLVPRRLFVINEKIEVSEPPDNEDTPQYNTIDKPGYQVRIEEAKDFDYQKQEYPDATNNKAELKKSGFLMLRYVESQARVIPEEDKTVEPQPGPSTEPDDLYEYSTITAINTPRLLNIRERSERRDTLPESCFSTREISKVVSPANAVEREKVVYELVPYINSKGFMEHFQGSVFPNSLGKALGFDMEEIKQAKSIPGKIFCNLLDEDLNTLPCEIIPSVAIQWPERLTYEFPERGERTTMWDKFGNLYKWPDDDMVKDITKLGCVVTPRGFLPKRGDNSTSALEWEVAFPKAERYLDARMSHAQIKVFLYLLAIHRTFIEPNTKHWGLLVEHIRTHMYWECESNPRDWPEHKLGIKILDIIGKLNKRLAKGHLPDYFIQGKNMLENVPNKYLRFAQKILHEVVESPVIYFISALRNLRYTSEGFFAPVDFPRLYLLMRTADCSKITNSALNSMVPPNLHPQTRRQVIANDVARRKSLVEKYQKERNMRERILMKRQKEKEQIVYKTERSGSVDSVDLEYRIEEKFDDFKCREVLRFFVEHFIEMARRCRILSTKNQSLLYLKQAYYLARIVKERGLELDGKEYFEKIAKEEETSKKISARESYMMIRSRSNDDMPPSTPRRSSVQFNSNWTVTQQVKANNINLHNLNQAYHGTSVVSPPPTVNKVTMRTRNDSESNARKSVVFRV